MVNANEARKIVEQGRYQKATKQMKEIENKIKESIIQGLVYASFDGIIEKANKEKLEELGYTISSGSQYNESYYSISW